MNTQGYQKEMSSLVLNVLFNTISTRNFDMTTTNLIQGWLDILLSMSSKNQQKEQCKLSVKGSTILFTNTCKFLKDNINYGGFEGCELASEMTIIKLELAKNLLKLMLEAKYDDSQTALVCLFKNVNENEASQAEF